MDYEKVTDEDPRVDEALSLSSPTFIQEKPSRILHYDCLRQKLQIVNAVRSRLYKAQLTIAHQFPTICPVYPHELEGRPTVADRLRGDRARRCVFDSAVKHKYYLVDRRSIQTRPLTDPAGHVFHLKAERDEIAVFVTRLMGKFGILGGGWKSLDTGEKAQEGGFRKMLALHAIAALWIWYSIGQIKFMAWIEISSVRFAGEPLRIGRIPILQETHQSDGGRASLTAIFANRRSTSSSLLMPLSSPGRSCTGADLTGMVS